VGEVLFAHARIVGQAGSGIQRACWKTCPQIRENERIMPQFRGAKRKTVFLAAAAVLAAFFLAAIGLFFRHGYDATLMLADLAGVELPLPDGRPAFERREIAYAADEERREADLYTPQVTTGVSAGLGVRAGLVLVPGAAETGRRDARLVEFAGILARSGFAVLVPDISSFRELRPSPESAREIAAGVAQLRQSVAAGVGALAEDLRLGIGAFSIASGPAVLAALEADADHNQGYNRGSRVDFLLLVGGYHDLRKTLTFMTTGYFEADGQPRQREPDAYGKWVYALSNAGRLPEPADRAALAAMAQRRMEDPGSRIDDLLAQLGPDGRAVYEFIDNRDPARVPGLLARMPAAVRADIEALDLARHDLSGLRADVILVHGLDDTVIPYTESVSLARALPPGRAQLFLLEGLHHVDREIRGLDAWRMWRAVQAVLAQREGGLT
jgi:pimeloyl-ACP methyl ester carboxylesterase